MTAAAAVHRIYPWAAAASADVVGEGGGHEGAAQVEPDQRPADELRDELPNYDS